MNLSRLRRRGPVAPVQWASPKEALEEIMALNVRDRAELWERHWNTLPFVIKASVFGEITGHIPGEEELARDMNINGSPTSFGNEILRFHTIMEAVAERREWSAGQMRKRILEMYESGEDSDKIEEAFERQARALALAQEKDRVKSEARTKNWSRYPEMCGEWLERPAAGMPLGWWKSAARKPHLVEEIVRHKDAPLAQLVTGLANEEAREAWHDTMWWKKALDTKGASAKGVLGRRTFALTQEALFEAPGMSEAGVATARRHESTAMMASLWERGPEDWNLARELLDRAEKNAVMEGLCRYPGRLPEDIAMRIAKEAESDTREALARRANISQEVQHLLAGDTDYDVRYALAQSAGTSALTARELLRDPDDAVAVCVAMRHEWREIATDAAMSAARSARCSATAIGRALYYGGEKPDWALLVTLMANPNPSVRDWARKTLLDLRRANTHPEPATTGEGKARPKQAMPRGRT